jgi:hypothetical protein
MTVCRLQSQRANVITVESARSGASNGLIMFRLGVGWWGEGVLATDASRLTEARRRNQIMMMIVSFPARCLATHAVL